MNFSECGGNEVIKAAVMANVIENHIHESCDFPFFLSPTYNGAILEGFDQSSLLVISDNKSSR